MSLQSNEQPGTPDPANELGGTAAESGGSALPSAHQDAPTGGQTAPTGVGAVSDIGQLSSAAVNAYVGFDPAIHATNPDGTPKLTAGGSWAKKRGRKPGSGKAGAPNGPAVLPQQNGAPQTAETKGVDSTQAAKMYCAVAVGGLMQVLGEEWDTKDKAETDGLIKATAAYLDATGGANMTPEAALFFSWGGYALPRLAMPETKSRLKKFAEWLGGMFRRK